MRQIGFWRCIAAIILNSCGRRRKFGVTGTGFSTAKSTRTRRRFTTTTVTNTSGSVVAGTSATANVLATDATIAAAAQTVGTTAGEIVTAVTMI